jgi:tRNA modification GTPase
MEKRVSFQDDIIAALATPLGESALAVIRTTGPGSIEALAPLTDRPKSISQAQGNTLVYGYLIDPWTKAPLDQVIFSIFRGPRSYTGEDSVEISCHGSIPGIQRILEVLYANGFRPAQGGEFTLRAFMNGKLDLTRAEAVQEIIVAKTKTAQTMALHRLSGSVEQRINQLKQYLVHVMAAVSIQLDYPEDEIGEVPIDLEKLDQIREGLNQLVQSYATGRLYQQGAVVVLAGRTNAGKSSLFNLFLKEDRAIVSHVHGTTRDYLEAPLTLQGIPLRFYDTAGLRLSDEAIESEGIRRTGNVIQRADILLYVADGTLGLTHEDQEILSSYQDKPLVKMWNKSDDPNFLPPPEGWLSMSAKEGRGVEQVTQAILQILTPGTEGTPSLGSDLESVIIDSLRQKQCLEQAIQSLDHMKDGLLSHMPMDVIALDLQGALNALGEITGEVTREDILDAMFSGFCVGK